MAAPPKVGTPLRNFTTRSCLLTSPPNHGLVLMDPTDSRGHPAVPYLTPELQLDGKSTRQVWTVSSTEQRLL